MMHRYAGWTVRQPVMVLMTQPRWAAAVSQLALQRHPWGLQLGCQCRIGCPRAFFVALLNCSHDDQVVC